MPIAAFLTVTAKPGMEDELVARFSDVLKDVRGEPGNLCAVLLRDPDRPDRLHEFAVYRDQAAIEAHRAAEHSLVKGPWVREAIAGDMAVRFFDTVDWPAD